MIESVVQTSTLRPRAPYYRTHGDFIAYLAVRLSELTAFQIKQLRDNAEGDLGRAKQEEIEQATTMLHRAGIRTPEETPPAWHFAKTAFARGAYE